MTIFDIDSKSTWSLYYEISVLTPFEKNMVSSLALMYENIESY